MPACLCTSWRLHAVHNGARSPAMASHGQIPPTARPPFPGGIPCRPSLPNALCCLAGVVSRCDHGYAMIFVTVEGDNGKEGNGHKVRDWMPPSACSRRWLVLGGGGEARHRPLKLLVGTASGFAATPSLDSLRRSAVTSCSTLCLSELSLYTSLQCKRVSTAVRSVWSGLPGPLSRRGGGEEECETCRRIFDPRVCLSVDT